MKTLILNHTSKETAYEIINYPYGRLKTSMFVWIETTPKKGDRVCRQTINPKNGRLNAVKCSTYANLMALYLDENNHVQSTGLNIYSKDTEKTAFIDFVGIENLNTEQVKQWNHLNGIHEKKVDEFTLEVKKDFSIKWETEIIGQGWNRNEAGERVWNKGEKGKAIELKVTFDRPDGVKVIEIFKAMKTVNQTRLNEVFEVRESVNFGSYTGTVRICTRGGTQLTTVREAEYKEFLASDYNVLEEEGKQLKGSTQIYG